jgi:hypothetical protein
MKHKFHSLHKLIVLIYVIRVKNKNKMKNIEILHKKPFRF